MRFNEQPLTHERVVQSARNPAIELYRVLLMFLIVLHHAAYHGHWNHAQGLDAAYPSICWLFTALVIWHVDGFVAITGWFGTCFSLARFAKLWGVIAFYSLLSVAYGWWSYGSLSSSYMAGGWFGQTYLYFLFLTPILNAAMVKLAGGGGGKYMYLSWLVFDVAVVLNWAPYHLLTSVAGAGTEGVSIITFVVVYVNARLIRMSGLDKYFSKKIFIVCCTLFLVGVVMSAFALTDLGYDSPFVILMAIGTLLFFEKCVRIPVAMAKTVAAISPLMFGVYILHETTTFGRLAYRLPQEWLEGNCNWHPLIIIFISAVFCFALCSIVDAIRRVAVVPLLRPMRDFISQLDARIGSDVLMSSGGRRNAL